MNLAGPERERTKLLSSMLKACLVFACYAQPPVCALLTLPADIAAHTAAALAAEAMGKPQQPTSRFQHLKMMYCVLQTHQQRWQCSATMRVDKWRGENEFTHDDV